MDDSRALAEEMVGPYTEEHAREGARNLLINAGEVGEGTDFLIIHSTNNFVDPEVTEIIADEARRLGATVHVLYSPPVDDAKNVSPVLLKAFENAEVTLFHHRISSQMRMMKLDGGRLISSFANTKELLASRMARTPIEYWRVLLRHLQTHLNTTRTWRIQCPDGTDLTGTVTPRPSTDKPAKDSAQTFATVSFPPGVFRPIDNNDTTGKLALRWFNNSGIHFENPPSHFVPETVLATVENGKFVDFEGSAEAVEDVTSFLKSLGDRWDKEPFMINGWHAGINSMSIPVVNMTDDMGEWVFLSHAHPRVVHFHAVGEIAPGEMSIFNLDPTITINDEVLWDKGRLVFAEREEVAADLAKIADPAIAAEWTPVGDA